MAAVADNRRTITTAAELAEALSTAANLQVANAALSVAAPSVAHMTMQDVVAEQEGHRVHVTAHTYLVEEGRIFKKEIERTDITISKADPAGPQSNGIWLPYLGNQGARISDNGPRASLGSYTPALGGGRPYEFVITGVFTGCYAGEFQSLGGVRFSHIATCNQNPVTAPTVDQQKAAIVAVMGGEVAAAECTSCTKPATIDSPGTGVVFWWWDGASGSWKKRVLQVGGAGSASGTGPVVDNGSVEKVFSIVSECECVEPGQGTARSHNFQL